MTIDISKTTDINSRSSSIAYNITQVPSTITDVSSGAFCYQNNSSSNRHNRDWIVDFRANDHITCDPNDFLCVTQSRRLMIFNTNGVQYSIIGVGTIVLSSCLCT